MLKTNWITNSPKTLKALVFMNMKDESYTLASWAYDSYSGSIIIARGMLKAKQSDKLKNKRSDKDSYKKEGIKSELHLYGFYKVLGTYTKLKEFNKRRKHE